MFYKTKSYRISWLICIIFFIIGLVLIDEKTVIYPVDEYWVAPGYRHVYDKYSKEIVNVIEADEKCEIKEDEIIVSKKKHGKAGNIIGYFFVIFAGIGMAYLTYEFFNEIWNEKHKKG